RREIGRTPNASRDSETPGSREASGVRASSAPLSQGRLQFDGRAGSWRASTTLMPRIATMNLTCTSRGTTNDEGSPNLEIRSCETGLLAFHWTFGFRYSFVIRISSLSRALRGEGRAFAAPKRLGPRRWGEGEPSVAHPTVQSGWTPC